MQWVLGAALNIQRIDFDQESDLQMLVDVLCVVDFVGVVGCFCWVVVVCRGHTMGHTMGGRQNPQSARIQT